MQRIPIQLERVEGVVQGLLVGEGDLRQQAVPTLICGSGCLLATCRNFGIADSRHFRRATRRPTGSQSNACDSMTVAHTELRNLAVQAASFTDETWPRMFAVGLLFPASVSEALGARRSARLAQAPRRW
jgi:hypothetical protein